MAVNKVIYNGETLMDLTKDTAAPENTLAGVTGHMASGEAFTGMIPSVAGGTITPGKEAQVAVAAGSYVTGDIVVAAVSGELTVVEVKPTALTQTITVPWPKDTIPKHTIVMAADDTVDTATTLPKGLYHGLWTKQTEGSTLGRMSGVYRKRPSTSATYYNYYAVGPGSSTSTFAEQEYSMDSDGNLVLSLSYCYFTARKYYVIGVYVD